MKAIQILFAFFLVVPFIEIYVLLQVGGLIGAFPTIFMVVFTAVLGAWLLRKQGFETWRRLQTNLQQGQIPAYEMIEGPIILIGGALLLTPGFFTDFLGFACLIPSLRRRIARYLIEHHLLVVQGANAFRKTSSYSDNVIEAEFEKKDD
ncbi:MAG: FxsA family protein [Methylococcaceae bacterium]|jgi:UPF0716 protein FxsA|nr:FxsA family protein [Methylococcaceae bacterium]